MADISGKERIAESKDIIRTVANGLSDAPGDTGKFAQPHYYVEAGFSSPMRVENHPLPAKAGIHMSVFPVFSEQCYEEKESITGWKKTIAIYHLSPRPGLLYVPYPMPGFASPRRGHSPGATLLRPLPGPASIT